MPKIIGMLILKIRSKRALGMLSARPKMRVKELMVVAS